VLSGKASSDAALFSTVQQLSSEGANILVGGSVHAVERCVQGITVVEAISRDSADRDCGKIGNFGVSKQLHELHELACSLPIPLSSGTVSNVNMNDLD
jgi:hypothetical protein